LTLIEVFERALQRFEPLSCFPEFPFRRQALVLGNVAGGAGDDRAELAGGPTVKAESCP
jgi:hypothetical protein